MKVIGISSYYHDSAAALLDNGNIISAVQEERYTRIKHDSCFPKNAIKFCTSSANININKIDYFVFYEKPFLKFERLLETYLSFAPRGLSSFKMAIPIWVKEKIYQKNLLIKELKNLGCDQKVEKKILFSEHHLSHAASAFFASPFSKAAILTLDGVGEWATTTIGIGNEDNISLLKEITFPNSLGLLYSAFTYYCGFKVNSGEYKLMGLAPYGEARYTDKIFNNLVDVKDDGSFRLNQHYFDYCTGLKMINKNFENLFGKSARHPNEKITKFYMDIAASIQRVLEHIVLKICKFVRQETKLKKLCMAGGVALNCVINGKIIKNGIFEDIWIQPAAGDAGGALGAALFAHTQIKKNKTFKFKNNDKMQGGYLGPFYKNADIKVELDKLGASSVQLENKEIIKKTVNALKKQKIVGWFQGKMEFGPRALGNRSILADPRSKSMQKDLNLKIKFRENFRPFAPSILKEKLTEWFDYDKDSPYMLLVYKVIKSKILKNKKLKKIKKINDILSSVASKIPSVTHVDNTARIHTVDKKINPKFYQLISYFYKETGCPILINTSFNIRSEPIVCSPTDAFRCFMGTDMDVLVIENFILYKNKQDKKLLKDYRENFELD